MFKKIRKWWLFHVVNHKVREGEKGGFKWCFRRFWLEISTQSGNFVARFTAAEHPYGYLAAGETDENIHGFAQILYEVGMLLTTDQGFANDIGKAINKYQKRLEKAAEVVEDETEEKIAVEEVKAVTQVSQMPKRYRKKNDRKVDKRLKKAVKKAE